MLSYGAICVLVGGFAAVIQVPLVSGIDLRMDHIPDWFEVQAGSRVVLFGIQKTKDLNGKAATVVRWQDGQWLVKMDTTQEEWSGFWLIKPINVKLLQETVFPHKIQFFDQHFVA